MTLGCQEADSILAAYRHAIADLLLTEPLTDFVKYHFIVRLWRLTGDALEWQEHPALVRHIDDTGRSLKDAVRVAEIGGFDATCWDETSAALRAAGAFVPQQWRTSGQTSCLREGRKEITPEKIRLWFLMALVMKLHKLHDHDLESHPLYSDSCRSARSTLQASVKLFDPKHVSMRVMLLEDPAKVTNCIFFLRRLGLADFVDQTWAAFQHIWDTDLVRRPRNWSLYVYGLTHFVLCESRYYQSRINLDLFSDQYAAVSATSSSSAYREILDIFRHDAELLFGLENPDILAEVGLCFRLCGRDCDAICQRCTAFVKSCVRFCRLERRTILFPPGEVASKGLRRAEHSNCVALLLLATWNECFQAGPQFSRDRWEEILASCRPVAEVHLPEIPSSQGAGAKKASSSSGRSGKQATQSLPRPTLAAETYGEKRSRLEALGVLALHPSDKLPLSTGKRLPASWSASPSATLARPSQFSLAFR